MRQFVCAMVCSLFLFGLLSFCHHDNIKSLRDDFQAYSNRSLLPPDDTKQDDIR